MTVCVVSTNATDKVRLKEPGPFFAAGKSFDRACSILSDGAFKLFAHLCVRSDLRTGRYEVALTQLAASLNKSRRVIGRYASEVQAKAVCNVERGSNQFARTVFEVCDDYWPYVRETTTSVSRDQLRYVETVQEVFKTIGCTRGTFRSSDEALAESFYERGIPLSVVTDALHLGAVRKYASWLNGNVGEKISSLKYFETVVEETFREPLPPEYGKYVRGKLIRLRRQWLSRS